MHYDNSKAHKGVGFDGRGNSASVLRIHKELILLAIAYLASGTCIENLSDFTAILDKLNMPCGLDSLVIEYFVYPSAGLAALSSQRRLQRGFH